MELRTKTLDVIRQEYRDANWSLLCARHTRLKAAYSDDLYTFGYMSFEPTDSVAMGISHVWDDEAPGHELEEARFETMNKFFFKGYHDAQADHAAGII